jgi:hypothetical protein
MFESATAPEKTPDGGNAKGKGEKGVASEGGNAKEESQNVVLFVCFKNRDDHTSMGPRLTYLRCHISIGQRARTLCKKGPS